MRQIEVTHDVFVLGEVLTNSRGSRRQADVLMAPATILAQGVALTDLDGPLLLAEDRYTPLHFDARGAHPPAADLWG